MLTEDQERYINEIPEGEVADIKPHDEEAANYAKELVHEIESSSGLEVLWSGALPLGILGSNDIDLTLFGDPKDFKNILPKIKPILGEPQIVCPEKVLWRTKKDGHKVDAYLGSKGDEEVKAQVAFFEALQEDEELLEEYRVLKKGSEGKSLREYQRKKAEFYNRVVQS